MDLSKYAALFLAESREHLNACNGSLLEWERAPSSIEPVDRLFRAIHTIKGMAATMGYSGVARLAHAGETLLDALRKGRVAAGPAVFQLLYRTVDTLGASVESAGAGTEQEPDTDLIAQLEHAAVTSLDAGTATPPPAPAPEEPKLRRATDAPRSRPISVVIRRGAVMRGARAALVLRRAETLGPVSGVQPPMAQLERDEFDGKLFFRLQTRLADQEIIDALRAVGDLDTIEFGEAAGRVRPGPQPPDSGRAGPARCTHEAGG